MTTNIDTDIAALRLMVRGAYDLQKLRMQIGLRLCANFRSKLKEPVAEDADSDDDPELSDDALKIIERLKASYRRLTDGVARNRTLPDVQGFEGDALISTHTELTLVDQYVRLESQETLQFRQMTATLERIPIYTEFLRGERGIGPALAAVLITYFDPAKANHASDFWAYAGLDVGPDGRARSKRKEHLIERAYTDRNGVQQTRMGTTYNPWVKSKLLGAMGPNFLRTEGCRWRKAYDDYRHRIETDPRRIKITVGEWKKKNKAAEDMRDYWAPGRIHRAAIRYAVKMFLLEFWRHWRALEGLPVDDPYAVAKQGAVPHGGAAAA